jgi:hypothetical protein
VHLPRAPPPAPPRAVRGGPAGRVISDCHFRKQLPNLIGNLV